MDHWAVRQRESPPDLADQLLVELMVPVVLLLLAGRALAELVRRHESEDVHIACGQVAIPHCRPTPGHHHHAPATRPLTSEPVQKRNPIQKLEADFARPWSDDDVAVASN